MPSELRLINKRKSAINVSEDSKRQKNHNIDDRLKILEEKEKTENDAELNEKNSDSENEEEEDQVGQHASQMFFKFSVNLQEIQADEEMDDENDYGNSYFDNGEAYNEEDDNLDDGPIY